MKSYVWIIEMLVNNKWQPCEDCRLTKSGAVEMRRYWKMNNPDDRLRIKKYEEV